MTNRNEQDNLRRDAELQAITVGKRALHQAPILLVSYNPFWPSWFAQLETKIREGLGTIAINVEHVGSTSVPELSAKPIIDINLEVMDSADEGSYVPALEAAGFSLHIREPDWFQHRLLKHQDPQANLHVFSSGCPELANMRIFRDWLRSSAEDRHRYEETKVKLAAKVWRHRQDYADAKSEIVHYILARAKRTINSP